MILDKFLNLFEPPFAKWSNDISCIIKHLSYWIFPTSIVHIHNSSFHLLSTYCVPKTENKMVNKNSISPSLVMLAYNQGKAPSIQLSSNKLKTLTMKNVARWRTWCCKKANLPKINLQQANLPKVNFPNDWFIEFPNRKFTERQFIQNQFLENQFDEK